MERTLAPQLVERILAPQLVERIFAPQLVERILAQQLVERILAGCRPCWKRDMMKSFCLTPQGSRIGSHCGLADPNAQSGALGLEGVSRVEMRACDLCPP